MSVKRLEHETPQERVERKSRNSGQMVIEPTTNCSLEQLLGGLENAGYELVDALYKPRIDKDDPRKTYHMVRFLFARCEFVTISDAFLNVRGKIRNDFQEMCRTAMWRVRSYRNPFFSGGEEIPGQYAVSVNLEVRKPFETASTPLRQNFDLRVESNTLKLAKA